MGCWGMGMAQSDEFCEIYDHFMEEYDDGKSVAEITAGILAKYHAEFDDADGVMHDVYFALAKSEWMCCEQSELVLNRVTEIIESGANLEFYRELEASDKDLVIRRRNLDKFLQSLQTPREKPRKRKRTAPAEEKAFPPLEAGDCFAFKHGEGYRIFAILERFKPKAEKEQVTILLFARLYGAEELNSADFSREEMGHMFTVTAQDFLGKSVIRKVSRVEITPKSRGRLLGVSAFMYGNKQSFRMEIKEPLGIALDEFLHACEENTDGQRDRLTVGGCYAYPFKEGYKFAVVLDRLLIEEQAHWLIAILSGVSKTPDTDFLQTNLSSLTLYNKDALPNLTDWVEVTTLPVPRNMQRKLFGNSRYIISGIFDFLQDRSSLPPRRTVFRTLAPLLEVCRENTREAFEGLEVGGCYAYPFMDGYKFAVIVDRFTVMETELLLVAVLWKTYPTLEADCLHDGLAHLGVYTADLLPNVESWTLRHKLDLPPDLSHPFAKSNQTTLECILKFFADPPYYSGAVNLSGFLADWEHP